MQPPTQPVAVVERGRRENIVSRVPVCFLRHETHGALLRHVLRYGQHGGRSDAAVFERLRFVRQTRRLLPFTAGERQADFAFNSVVIFLILLWKNTAFLHSVHEHEKAKRKRRILTAIDPP